MGYTGEARKQYQVLWLKRRRQEWIDSKGGACVSCGSTGRLEIDHIDPAGKKYNPTQIWSRRAEVREEELAKCQVLCHDCHTAKTTQQSGVEHGGGHSGKYRCKCAACKAKKAQATREYRAKKLGTHTYNKEEI